tara:strand:+ start:23049 stop:24506 length:1458 start_codon:yes stop_codon:yes gene_type:complete
MKYCVVGAGTAGLISALMLKTRFPNNTVDIICSKKIGIIGVGEGSTEHWSDFADYVGIDTAEMIKETDATLKVGIMFKDWGVPDYMHSIQDGYNLQIGSQYPYIYGNIIKDNVHSNELSNKSFWDNKINQWYIDNNRTPVAQYHFNTFKLNEFLTKKAVEKGITIIDDEILDVVHDSTGKILHIKSNTFCYEYDFYIDCSGFKKLLISSLGANWRSYNKYLSTNSAIVFQTPDTEDYNMWSLSQAMKCGWMFRTPTYGRWGNGYIYDDKFLTPEQAKEEVEAVLGFEITIGQHIKFEPGALDNAWIKNCCAIGLSSSFIEPLEASSIGSSVQQMFMLIHSISNYNETTIKQYNKSFRSLVDNIRDFIVLHFMCKRNDTAYWNKVSKLEIPNSLQEKLDIWKNRLPTEIDFDTDTKFILFKALHFLMVLHGLQMFDIEKIKQEYNSISEDIKQDADRVRSRLIDEANPKYNFITHKEFLKVIRESI